MSALPYVTSPGNIDRALTGIKHAAVPEKVSQDFVKTILKVPGGSGDQMTAYLKKLALPALTGRQQKFTRDTEIQLNLDRQLPQRSVLHIPRFIFAMSICMNFQTKLF